ncbi:MAG TPA: ABC transporter permease subunit [Nitrososphaerales archaeon]|nr:ABC transporter permease subunit [Nitrososphaerales archaeon]
MRLSKSWIIASKDFAIFRKKKNIIYTIAVVPLLVAFLISGVLWYAGQRNGGTRLAPAELAILLPAFSFFYLILAGYLPTTIASYSLVGEKVEKSLEPLLATPTTDSEILLGKSIAALILPVAGILVGSTIFMTLMDLVTRSHLGYYFFPNLNSDIVFFIMVPLAALLSVEWNVIISSKVSDIRIAQQFGALAVIPLAGIYVTGEIGLIDLGITNNLLYIIAALAAIDVILFVLARAAFRREEILTKWK